jgi:hypothetical protein
MATSGRSLTRISTPNSRARRIAPGVIDGLQAEHQSTLTRHLHDLCVDEDILQAQEGSLDSRHVSNSSATDRPFDTWRADSARWQRPGRHAALLCLQGIAQMQASTPSAFNLY